MDSFVICESLVCIKFLQMIVIFPDCLFRLLPGVKAKLTIDMQNPGPCRISGPQATFKSQIPTPRAIFLS